MKLKFKATTQDWTIFALFLVFLLLVVSVLVNNISSFLPYYFLYGYSCANDFL